MRFCPLVFVFVLWLCARRAPTFFGIFLNGEFNFSHDLIGGSKQLQFEPPRSAVRKKKKKKKKVTIKKSNVFWHFSNFCPPPPPKKKKKKKKKKMEGRRCTGPQGIITQMPDWSDVYASFVLLLPDG